MPRGRHDSHGLRTTRWPTSKPVGLRTQLDHLGHHLVAHHLGERAEAAHGVVAVAVAEVEQDLLRVRPADPGEQRSGHQPVGAQRAGIGDLAERHRGVGQVLAELVGAGRRGPVVVPGSEHESLHRSISSLPLIASPGGSSCAATLPPGPAPPSVSVPTMAFFTVERRDAISLVTFTPAAAQPHEHGGHDRARSRARRPSADDDAERGRAHRRGRGLLRRPRRPRRPDAAGPG